MSITYEAVEKLVNDTNTSILMLNSTVAQAHDALVKDLPVIKAAVDSATVYNKVASEIGAHGIDIEEVIANAVGAHVDKVVHACNLASNVLLSIKRHMDGISPPGLRDNTAKHPALTYSFRCNDGNAINLTFEWFNIMRRYGVAHNKHMTVITRDNSEIMFGTNGVIGAARMIIIDYDPISGRPICMCLLSQPYGQTDTFFENMIIVGNGGN